MISRKVTIKEYGGDDKYSWAVFVDGNVIRGLTGLSKQQAVYYRDQVKIDLDAK